MTKLDFDNFRIWQLGKGSFHFVCTDRGHGISSCLKRFTYVITNDMNFILPLPSWMISVTVFLGVPFVSLYLGSYRTDFDETWWMCWNLGPMDCMEISWKSVKLWHYYDILSVSFTERIWGSEEVELFSAHLRKFRLVCGSQWHIAFRLMCANLFPRAKTSGRIRRKGCKAL